jgi:hypothetical protein
LASQLPGQDSNLDKESQNLNDAKRNSKRIKPLAKSNDDGRTAGRTGRTSEGGVLDADIAALVAAWPLLPEPIKAVIRTVIAASAG